MTKLSSILSPPTRIAFVTIMPPKEITETSVVPLCHTPFETREIEESDDKASDFLSKEVFYNSNSAYGFSLALYYDTFALSFATSEEWEKSRIQVVRHTGELLEIHHISKPLYVKIDVA